MVERRGLDAIVARRAALDAQRRMIKEAFMDLHRFAEAGRRERAREMRGSKRVALPRVPRPPAPRVSVKRVRKPMPSDSRPPRLPGERARHQKA